MTDHENIAKALEAAASHPKVATAVAVTTAGMGVSSLMSEIQTALGLVSLVIGCVVGLYVIFINHTKAKIYRRMLKDGESLKE